MNIFFDIQKKTKILLGLSAVACVLSALLYASLMYMLMRETAAVASIPQEAMELSQKAALVQTARRTLAETAAERAALAEFFFSSDDIARFLEEMEKAARGVGVSLTIISANAEKDNGLRIEANMAGTWEGVARFLSLLDAHPAPIDIVRISINKKTSVPASAEEKKKNKTPPASEWSGGVTFILQSYEER